MRKARPSSPVSRVANSVVLGVMEMCKYLGKYFMAYVRHKSILSQAHDPVSTYCMRACLPN